MQCPVFLICVSFFNNFIRSAYGRRNIVTVALPIRFSSCCFSSETLSIRSVLCKNINNTF